MKKSRTKKILSLFFAIIMIISCIPFSSIATTNNTYTFVEGNYTYTYSCIYNNNVPSYLKLDSFTQSIPAEGSWIYIPSKYTIDINGTSYDLPVKEIGYHAFYYNTSMIRLTVPETLEKIDNEAFIGCRNFLQLMLPEGFKTIGDNAFSYTGLELINLPNSTTSISASAFTNCPLDKALVYANSYASQYIISKGLTALYVPDLYSGIYIEGDPKTTYNYGEVCNGATITINDIENGSFYTEYFVKGFNSKNPGPQTITFEVNGLTTMLNIYIMPQGIIYGDVNLDGKVSIVDSKILLNGISGNTILTNNQIVAGDMDHNGIISIVDAKLLLNYISSNA